ncbi:RcnB family protein [Phenylobacterium deserti]|uniref:Uncharacterized protein n=1 Tax=Phenylobacterium deserti TaxID=1914756 RepID=A0A328ATA2_9CAUL|nr:RcnB family protein [Phenylobacterium deserti]RAK57827.1 hypothetical protein DJ018_07900 [Phenylobacterium deserti]
MEPMSKAQREAGREVFLSLTPLVVLVIGLIVSGVWNVRADKRSTPYLRNPNFEALPGCPTRLRDANSIYKACVDKRYLIRLPSRYNLPRPLKGYRWIRVGPDAVSINCYKRSCAIDEVRRGTFSPGAKWFAQAAS